MVGACAAYLRKHKIRILNEDSEKRHNKVEMSKTYLQESK